MKKPLLSTNNIWVAIGIALATAILSAATFNGLMYARLISSDWGTLYLTLLSGLTFAAIGFILSVITLLTHTSYNSEKTP